MTRALGRLTGIAGEALADLIAPLACPICGAETRGSPLCDACRAELLDASSSPTCPRCGLLLGPWARLDKGCSSCRGKPLGFDAALALAPYQGPLRDLCLRLKDRRGAWLARWLAELVVEARRGPLEAELARDPRSLVVPVPLHWLRRLERGYNQAEALADALARRLGLGSSRPLRRIKRTKLLAGIGRTERAEQLRGAFRSRPLDGRTVLLVDDILTTGATCGSAARALKKAGAARVVAVVVARAEGRA
ncbi:MAG TPA: ComF family protein [Isosphaeraceae bacterium]|jgi:ComF family protein